MVMARLHIICGNCGSNDEFEFETSFECSDDVEGDMYDEVHIRCNNCGTIHTLSDTIPNRHRKNE